MTNEECFDPHRDLIQAKETEVNEAPESSFDWIPVGVKKIAEKYCEVLPEPWKKCADRLRTDPGMKTVWATLRKKKNTSALDGLNSAEKLEDWEITREDLGWPDDIEFSYQRASAALYVRLITIAPQYETSEDGTTTAWLRTITTQSELRDSVEPFHAAILVNQNMLATWFFKPEERRAIEGLNRKIEEYMGLIQENNPHAVKRKTEDIYQRITALKIRDALNSIFPGTKKYLRTIAKLTSILDPKRSGAEISEKQLRNWFRRS
jgi:hypothetical protein